MKRLSVLRSHVSKHFDHFVRQRNVTTAAWSEAKTNDKVVSWEHAKPFEAIPGPKALPIIGNAWRLINMDINKLNQEMRQKYGDIVYIRDLAPGWSILNLYNVKDIESLLRNEGPYPIRHGFESMFYYRHVMRKDVFGDQHGLVNGQGEQWLKSRTVANSVLMQPRSMNNYANTVNKIADEFVEHVKELKARDHFGIMPQDFLNEVNKFVFDSITDIALNKRLNCFSANPSQQALDAIGHILDMFSLTLPMDILLTGKIHRKLNTRLWRRYIANHDFFTDWILEMLNEAEKQMAEDPNYKNKPESEKSIFEKFVEKDRKVAIVMTLDMLIAGVETTSVVCGSTLYFIARNVDAQRKLRDELLRLLPRKDTPITPALLVEAKYLRACIKESLRIAPVSHVTARWTSKDMVFSGYRIPAGTEVNCPHLYLSAQMEHYPRPNEYMPDRWLRDDTACPEMTAKNVNPFVTRPFGFGARSCVGRRVASLQLEIFTAKMLRNFLMEWPHEDMRFKQNILYTIADPLRLQLKDAPN